MSCRKARRELLDRFRFGEELDASTDGHLAHLQSCPACRTEVGLDLALVTQLRYALRQRVEGFAPSPAAWGRVRSQLTAPAPPSWGERIGRWARLAPAGAAMALMLFVVVTGTEEDRPLVLQPRTWSNVLEAEPNVPEPGLPWYIKYRPAPPISPPATGATAWVDPDDARHQRPAPEMVSGIVR